MNPEIRTRIIKSIKSYIDNKTTLEDDLLENQIKMRNQSRFIYREEIMKKYSKGIKTSIDHVREIKLFSEFRENLSKKTKKESPLKNITIVVSNLKNFKKNKPSIVKLKHSESQKRVKIPRQSDTNLPRPLTARLLLKLDSIKDNDNMMIKSTIFKTQFEAANLKENTEHDKTNLRSAPCSAISTNMGTDRKNVRSAVRFKTSAPSQEVSQFMKRKIDNTMRFRSINPKIAKENPDYFDKHLINPMVAKSINNFNKVRANSAIKFNSGCISVPFFSQLNDL
jgi:hypothetical protein